MPNSPQNTLSTDADAPDESALPVLSSSAACCDWGRMAMVAMTLVTAVSITATGFFAGRMYQAQAPQPPKSSLGGLDLPLIDASGAVTSEQYSMATGGVSDDADGLFVLDHNTGLLQCAVMYPRSGQFMALFTANVAEALGSSGKGSQYIMVTGTANFPRASNRPTGRSVIYVMDTATGNFACYGVPFDRQAVANNRTQQDAIDVDRQRHSKPDRRSRRPTVKRSRHTPHNARNVAGTLRRAVRQQHRQTADGTRDCACSIVFLRLLLFCPLIECQTDCRRITD